MLSLINKLKARRVNINDILLDPNNPRFIGKKFTGRLKSSGTVPENRFAESTVQQHALEKMMDEEFDVKSVRDSIRENGFLPLDQIVVRPVADKFVVVEGNRRVAAIKTLLKQVDSGEVTLEEDEVQSLKKLTVLVLNSSDEDAQSDQWLLQGIRHLSGIKDWGPYQKASLINQMFEQGRPAREIAASLGMTVVMVNRYYRTFQLIKQMESFEEYSQYAGPELFTHFEEAYRIPKIREYLGWSEAESNFTNEERLVEFYSWIVPSDELGGERKLSRGKDVDYLKDILEVPAALEVLREPGKSLNEVLIKLGGEQEVDWRSVVEEALHTLEKLSIVTIESFSDEDFRIIERLVKEGAKRQKQALAIREVDG